MDATAASALLAALSGLFVITLGVCVLLIRPRRAGSVAFGAFALAWGGLIVLGNVSRLIPDPAQTRPWALGYLAFLSVAWAPLLLFAFTHPQPRGWLGRSRRAWWLLAALAAVGPASLLVRPDLLYGDGGVRAWGPLYLTYGAAFFASFFAAFLVLRHAAAQTQDPQEQRRTNLFVLAFALYLAYWSAEILASYGLPLLGGTLPDATRQQAGIFLSVALAGLGMLALDLARVRGWPGAGRRILLCAVPFAAGLVSGYTKAYAPASTLDTVGLWRSASVGLMALSIFRDEFFAIEMRTRRLLAGAFLAAMGAMGALAVDQALEHVVGSVGLALLVTQIAGAGLLVAWLARRRGRVLLALAALVHEAPAATPGEGPPAGTRLGAYAVLEKLGGGANATVHLALDEALGREVVLKVPRSFEGPELERFLEEARILGSLDHPRIVRVHACPSLAGRPVLVLEHAPGGTLADRLRGGPLPPAEACAIMADVLDGLAYMHARGLAHRDVKPANVVFGEAGDARLADFGLARSRLRTQRGLAHPGVVEGTPAYLGPEGLRGALPDPRGDVYACGIVLGEMLSGTPTWERGALPSQDPAGARLAAVAERASSEDPAARYADAESMRRALLVAPTSSETPAASAPRQ